ncbi:unnamed protein product [Medioppia subpectinata]|uniref:Phosphomevalonate kinase n=1 Tax=Medioppia subpectinata TaxID=1979941 RepID=A0A7R9PU25_9ACAR|nr:unnamed protein product [Medioppia subpectinata]CAG2100329.1 unnamed protein product [Medioppia subpectinata]
MDNKNPKTVLLISGKRKSGKDFCVDLLSKYLSDFVVFRIAAPIKRQFAKDHGLDFDRLLDATHYKEDYRQQMVVWSERIRASDPNYFLRLTIEESNAKCKSIWILSDTRRLCDVQYFKANQEFKDSRVLAIRISASVETRVKRGWSFTAGIDDKETECGLDSYTDWDYVIDNDGSEDDLMNELKPIIQLINS